MALSIVYAATHGEYSFWEIARIFRWKLSPAANCPGLPVNDERNEG
jgi:hypothetical protein